jgi:hypothetical protein
MSGWFEEPDLATLITRSAEALSARVCLVIGAGSGARTS